jgi:hypothetical protein
MDAIGVCNLALNQLKCRNILSFEDNTEEAYQCRRLYAPAREFVLRQQPWGFARRVARLALTDYVNPLWRYFYAWPADCLKVRRLFGADCPAREAFYPVSRETSRAWEVFSASEAEKVIGANLAAAWLDYTYDAKNAEVFPPDFVAALYYYLAAELAMALSADASLKQLNFQLMQNALREAARQNQNEGKGRFCPVDSVLEARR